MTKDDYTFFWKIHEENDVFSQWYKASFTVDGVRYNTAEQFMMHQKALLFNDGVTATKIMNESNPKKQKDLGREVSNFKRHVWEQHCEDIVYRGNLAKFEQNPPLSELLKNTRPYIAEASPVDPIWGTGMAKDNPEVCDQSKWPGKNLLGKALMKVRLKLFNL